MNPMNENSELQNEQDLSFFSPFFLGAYGENSEILEQLLVEFVRDHIYWRRNFHPEDARPITPQMTQTSQYNDSIAKIRKELHSLTAKLKRTVPIYNPRYVGQMASDLMLPALLAQLVTTFYNPNNSANQVGDVTIKMELEVGNQFADMFGFNTDSQQSPCAWGHLTSGGTDANYESLWNFRAVKYYPVALVEALKKMELEIKFEDLSVNDPAIKNPFDYTPWELINLSIDTVLELRHKIFDKVLNSEGYNALKEFSRLVEDNRLESLGPAQFFAEHWKFHQPVVLVPSTAYSFWKKAMRLLGFGSASLVKVPLTHTMRMDEKELERILNKLHTQNIPVLAVIGVLGTLDFGTIDPVHEIIRIQSEFAIKGLNFYVHVDASCGGYLKALFRDKEGNDISRKTITDELHYFPSEQVYQAFMSLNNVDSITVAPHTFGYLPQGIGGFIARNREIVKLLNHSERNLLENDDKLDLLQLSRFILDGAKPGANAAAAYVTHKVLPLDGEHFGRIIKQTIRASECFFNKLKRLKSSLKGKAHLCVPFEPDSNLIAVSINPHGNRSLSVMNEFMSEIFDQLSHNPSHSVQTKEFLGSTTSLNLYNLTESERTNLFKLLHLETCDIDKVAEQKVYLLRHSMMNPWITSNSEGRNYLDNYCDFLESVINTIIEEKT